MVTLDSLEKALIRLSSFRSEMWFKRDQILNVQIPNSTTIEEINNIDNNFNECTFIFEDIIA